MHNHRLLRSFGDGEWLTIKGGRCVISLSYEVGMCLIGPIVKSMWIK